jgi:hypothetical protein
VIAKDNRITLSDEFPLFAMGSPPVNFLVKIKRHAALLKELDADCLSFAQAT